MRSHAPALIGLVAGCVVSLQLAVQSMPEQVLAPKRIIEPLLLDLAANGFQLTSVAEGVKFDLAGNGAPEQMAWTVKNGDDAFLALDVTHTGRIEDGRKLLGGLHNAEVGFTVLRQLEEAGQGPTARDAQLTEGDSLYSELVLWIDTNHNGISEADELRTLASAGVVRIFFGVVGLNQPDQYGNIFHYSAQALVKNRYGVPVATEVRSVRFAR